MRLFFSDYFGITKEQLHEYGTIDISLATDLPLFIDPFLLFNSGDQEYQNLHEGIIKYLRFLRDKSSTQASLSKGQLEAWYYFQEVKQTWLGFTFFGNTGSGLGPDFAKALHENLHSVFSSFGDEDVTQGSHLEKLCLIKDNVGKDNISDFTTNLIKAYLLEFTQKFALENIDQALLKEFPIRRVNFNYITETWTDKTFTLPSYLDDFVLLCPREILTKDETWINKHDLVGYFDEIPYSVSNEQLREQINNYFRSVLPAEPSQKEREEAVVKTIKEFPPIIDYYIKYKEDNGNEAEHVSSEKVSETEGQVQQAQDLMGLLSKLTQFNKLPASSLDEAIARAKYLKQCIENNDGYQIINGREASKPGNEKKVQLLFNLVWFGSIFDLNREVNNGRGPVDATVSLGSLDKSIIEFKLGSNSKLQHGLEKQTDVYMQANQTEKKLIIIICYTEEDQTKVDTLLRELGLSNAENIIVIDARNDNKPSASRS